MTNIVKLDYQNYQVSFNSDGWINATVAAKRFGKVPNEWLRLSSTESYLVALAKALNITVTDKSRNGLVKTVKGGNNKNNQGTWIHPKLVVAFARWLSIEFAVWCDLTIDSLLTKASVTYSKVENMFSMSFNEAKEAASISGKALRKYRDAKPILHDRQLKLIFG